MLSRRVRLKLKADLAQHMARRHLGMVLRRRLLEASAGDDLIVRQSYLAAGETIPAGARMTIRHMENELLEKTMTLNRSVKMARSGTVLPAGTRLRAEAYLMNNRMYLCEVLSGPHAGKKYYMPADDLKRVATMESVRESSDLLDKAIDLIGQGASNQQVSAVLKQYRDQRGMIPNHLPGALPTQLAHLLDFDYERYPQQGAKAIMQFSAVAESVSQRRREAIDQTLLHNAMLAAKKADGSQVKKLLKQFQQQYQGAISSDAQHILSSALQHNFDVYPVDGVELLEWLMRLTESVREAMTPQQRAKLEEIGNTVGGYHVPHLMVFLTDPIASSLYRKGMVMPQERDSKGVQIKLTGKGEQVLSQGSS